MRTEFFFYCGQDSVYFVIHFHCFLFYKIYMYAYKKKGRREMGWVV